MRERTLSITFLLFPGFTALDVVGPYEVLSRVPGASCKFVGIEKGTYDDEKGLRLSATFSIQEVLVTDVLVIPGGYGVDQLLGNDVLRTWITQIDKSSLWTTSVCSGALLLADAGLLKGRSCTTHQRRKEQLRKFNVCVEDQRFVRDGKYITSAGVSAGIDMVLFLAGLLTDSSTVEGIRRSMELESLEKG